MVNGPIHNSFHNPPFPVSTLDSWLQCLVPSAESTAPAPKDSRVTGSHCLQTRVFSLLFSQCFAPVPGVLAPGSRPGLGPSHFSTFGSLATVLGPLLLHRVLAPPRGTRPAPPRLQDLCLPQMGRFRFPRRGGGGASATLTTLSRANCFWGEARALIHTLCVTYCCSVPVDALTLCRRAMTLDACPSRCSAR